MNPICLLPLLALLQGAFQEAKKPDPPDRSAEPILKRIMESMSKLRDARITLNTSTRSRDRDVLEPDQTVTVWLAGGSRAAIVFGSMWGDAGRLVSDGKSVLIDPLDDTQPIVVKDGVADLYQADDNWARQGDPFLYLLAGHKAIDKMVAKDGFIKELPQIGDERAIQFKSSKKGTATLFYLANDRQTLVRRIEYDNRPWLEEQVKLYPEWYDAPEQPLTRVVVDYEMGVRAPRGTFDTKPPKGKTVTDQRKKPAKKPPLVSSALAGP